MSGALDRLAAFYRRPGVRRAIDLALMGAGAAAARRLLVDIHARLDALEGRGGLVPRDDLVTLGDLAKVEGRVRELEAADQSAPGGG